MSIFAFVSQLTWSFSSDNKLTKLVKFVRLFRAHAPQPRAPEGVGATGWEPGLGAARHRQALEYMKGCFPGSAMNESASRFHICRWFVHSVKRAICSLQRSRNYDLFLSAFGRWTILTLLRKCVRLCVKRDTATFSVKFVLISLPSVESCTLHV